jgi:hypothetical protein
VCSPYYQNSFVQKVFCKSKSMRNGLSRTWLVLLSVLPLTPCLVLPSNAESQPQDSQPQHDQSASDAPRQNREQKKNAAKQSRVISNEDLDLEYFKRGQEGFNFGAPATQPSEEPNAIAAAATEVANPSANSPDREARSKDNDSAEVALEDAEIAKLKENIKETEEKLQWQQRELALDQDSVYSNPNYTDLQMGKAKLDSEQQAINDRQQEIEVLKANLLELEERRTQAAPPAKTPPPTPVPPRP